MLVLQTQGLIAFAFAFVKIQMQYAVAAPYVRIRQQVFQQSARVAVACQQQLGLFGIVWRYFGVEQALAVAAACPAPALPASKTVTRTPCSASLRAVAAPAMPAPMIRTCSGAV